MEKSPPPDAGEKKPEISAKGCLLRLLAFGAYLGVLAGAGSLTGWYLAHHVVPRTRFPLGLTPGLDKKLDLKKCGDFKTQQEAQEFFMRQGGPEKDPHHLDTDGNGQACDHLP